MPNTVKQALHHVNNTRELSEIMNKTATQLAQKEDPNNQYLYY